MASTSQTTPSGELFKLRRRNLSNIPWWAVFLAAIGIFLTYLIFSSQNYRETFQYLVAGVLITLRMTLIAFPIATVIGLITGLMRTSKNVFFYNLSTIYVEAIRGIPLVVILLYFAFGLMPMLVIVVNQIGAWGLSWADSTILVSFFTALTSFSTRSISYESRAIIGLSVGYGAFEAEVFRAGIQSIGKGQMEAALSLGMTYMQAMRHIILPQAVRRVLPPGDIATLAVVPGEGLTRVFQSLGTTAIVPGGQTMNPSTQDFIKLLDAIPTDKAILLPNNSNVIMAARQAAELSKKQVLVVPTKTIPQGIAAMLAFNDQRDLDTNARHMDIATSHVQTGEITTATRAIDYNGINIDEGHIIGLVNDELTAADGTLEGILWMLLAQMKVEELEIVTLYYGNGGCPP